MLAILGGAETDGGSGGGGQPAVGTKVKQSRAERFCADWSLLLLGGVVVSVKGEVLDKNWCMSPFALLRHDVSISLARDTHTRTK